MRRKGELSPTGVDSSWRHQAASAGGPVPGEEHGRYPCGIVRNDNIRRIEHQKLMNRHECRKAAKIGARGMTTFWLTFTDTEASADKRFLGVAIFDMDESQGQLSGPEIVKRSWELGVNPGGEVLVQDVPAIPDEHKNKLITDDALLLTLGSRGRMNPH